MSRWRRQLAKRHNIARDRESYAEYLRRLQWLVRRAAREARVYAKVQRMRAVGDLFKQGKVEIVR